LITGWARQGGQEEGNVEEGRKGKGKATSKGYII